ncbi:MAG TPA: hypothetical protein VGN88_06055 [Phycisphaerae bacterium]
MLPIIPKPPISPKQKAAALAVAGTIDLLQIALLPALGFGLIFDEFLDFAAAIILMIICGFKWQFIAAFTLELVPMLDLFPTWTAVVAFLPTAKVTARSSPDVSASSTGPSPASAPPRMSVTRVVDVDAVNVPPVQPPSGT